MKCLISLHDNGIIPTKSYGSEDAGWDVYYNGPDITIDPSLVYDLTTGVSIAPAPGYWAEITHRSSSTMKGYGVVRGIIDNGYRGELLVRVVSFRQITIHNRERVGQLIFHEIIPVEWEESDELPESRRQKKGFGSSGD